MNYCIITICLVLLLSALNTAGQKPSIEDAIDKLRTSEKYYKSDNGCVCISSNFGCENIKGKTKFVQAGLCSRRCCTDADVGEKRQCQCMNINECPDDYPIEQGDCIKMVECCPTKSAKKRKTEF